jgi:hypothetical protein
VRSEVRVNHPDFQGYRSGEWMEGKAQEDGVFQTLAPAVNRTQPSRRLLPKHSGC